LEIRKITENERCAVNRLHNYVYGQWADGQVKPEDLSYILPNEAYGVFKNGKLVSTFNVLALQQSIRGVLKRMGGIAMVGTYPEDRYQGYIREMMKPAFEEMKAKELAFSALTPFRDSFYARFGYVTANNNMITKVPLEGIRYTLKDQIVGDWEFERVRASEAKKAFLDFIWKLAPSQLHGFIIYPTISDAEWTRRNRNQLVVFVKKQGTIEAVARYRIQGFGHGTFGEDGELIVEEMYWRSFDARNKLFQFFANHIDQCKWIIMNLPFGTSIQPWIVDQMVFIEMKVWFPWVCRVVDVEAALDGLPAVGTAELTFELSDEHCDWNNGIYTLKADKSKLSIHRSMNNPDVKMVIEGISALVYGTLPVEEIEYKGWLEFFDKQAKQILQRWFPPMPVYSAFGY